MNLRDKEWVAGQRLGPAVDPDWLSGFLQRTELRRDEEAKLRLREWERSFYADDRDGPGYSA